MKIGILTFHRPHNYGALLQAIALRYYLVNLGHEVYYVDYWPEYHANLYSTFNRKNFDASGTIGRCLMLTKFLFTYIGRKKRIDAFVPVIEKYIEPYCKPYSSDYHYDLVIYGSDQIWRNFRSLGNRQDLVYFGINEIHAKMHASYAASMGNIIVNDEDIPILKKGLSRFKMIGVREKSLISLMNDWGFTNVSQNIDPTLLLNSEQWNEILNPKRLIKEPYIVVYSIREAFDDKQIKLYAQRHDLRIVKIGSRFSFKDRHNEYNVASLYDFISLIKYADFCFMASFHGLVFSILFQRQFYTSFATAADRAKTLLEDLGLSDRMLPAFSIIPQEQRKIDYKIVTSKLDEHRVSSEKYIKRLISENDEPES